MMTSIYPLARVGSELEKKKQEEEKEGNPRMAGAKVLLQSRVVRKGEKGKRLSLYRKWGWVPQLMELVGLKHGFLDLE